jgi:hypothetical protein
MILLNAYRLGIICMNGLNKTTDDGEKTFLADIYNQAYIAQNLSPSDTDSFVSLTKEEGNRLLEIAKK